jgi:hypothetical protein
MSFGGVGGSNRKRDYNVSPSGDDESTVSAASVLFNVDGKKLKLLKKSIKDVSKKYARIAREQGATDDEEAFSKQMTDDIFEALQSANKEYRSGSGSL